MAAKGVQKRVNENSILGIEETFVIPRLGVQSWSGSGQSEGRVDRAVRR